MSTLLSVDWDAFMALPKPGDVDYWLYDWTSRDAPFWQDGIWQARALGFLLHDLPLPTTTGEERGLWERIDVSRGAPLYVADSHAHIVTAIDMEFDVEAIYNLDAHHDMGYNEGRVAELHTDGKLYCDTWGVWAQTAAGIDVHVRYPAWRRTTGWEEAPPVARPASIKTGMDDLEAMTFDAVFLCRSSPWMPPWLDQGFERLVTEYWRRHRSTIKRLDAIKPRSFDDQQARQHVEAIRTMGPGRVTFTTEGEKA